MLLTRPRILDYVPEGYTARKEQCAFLLEFQAAWESGATCIVPQVPVAGGKSLLARTILGYAEAHNMDSAYCVPDGLLQSQVQADAPELCSVWGKWAYACEKGGPCDGQKEPCEGCPYERTMAEALVSRRRLMNFHTLRALRGRLRYPRCVVFDEAHKLVGLQDGETEVRLWQHEHHWPESLASDVDLLEWIEREGRQVSKRWAQLSKARSLLLRQAGDVFLSKTWATHRKKDQRLLTLKPLSPRHQSPTFWPPKSVQRVVAMSATINELDIQDLGFDLYHKVTYLGCDSPIPPKSREIRCLPVVDMRFAKREESVAKVAAHLDTLLDVHAGAGLIHVTYDEMELYRGLLTHPRYLWHTQANRLSIYKQWVAGRLGTDRVLVAAGMHEGIDLKGDRARWQVVTRVPTLSMADPVIAYRAEREPTWYAWQSVKAFSQAVGRVCRTPDDFGFTYCFDAYLRRLYDQYEWLFPQYVKDSLTWLI